MEDEASRRDAKPFVAPRRDGVVGTVGRSWKDNGGTFYPLGGTLFWAGVGVRREPDRYDANLAFLAKYGVDFQRILGDVEWMDLDSSAPDYEQYMASAIDRAYDQFGVRTEIACWGGSRRDPLNLARRIANVVRGREHKILDLEPSNESYDNGPSDDIIAQMIAILRTTGLPVAGSSPGPDDPDANAKLAWYVAHGATVGTVHPDRGTGDDDWRFIRQVWELRSLGFAVNDNEPKGPRSSVAQTTSAVRLATARAVGILCGATAYVLHNGAGVAGVVDPAHDRPANLWEVPGIDDVMQAVRRVDAFLPVGVEAWEKTTQHGPTPVGPQPFTADAIWSDGNDHGCSRCYGAVHDYQICTVVYGVKGYVDLRASLNCAVMVTDIVTGLMTLRDFRAGEVLRLNGGPSNDPSGATYIIHGSGAMR